MGIFVRSHMGVQTFEADALIFPGSIVALDRDVNTGEIRLCYADRSAHLEHIVGIAGYNSFDIEETMIGASGNRFAFFEIDRSATLAIPVIEDEENRIISRSSIPKDTITVFSRGGEFGTDQYNPYITAYGEGISAVDTRNVVAIDLLIGTHLSVGMAGYKGQIIRNNNSRLNIGVVSDEVCNDFLYFRLNIDVSPENSIAFLGTPLHSEKIRKNETSYKYKNQPQSEDDEDDEDYPILIEL